MDDVLNILQAISQNPITIDEATTALITDFLAMTSTTPTFMLNVNVKSGKAEIQNNQNGGIVMALRHTIADKGNTGIEFVLYENLPTMASQRNLSFFANNIPNANQKSTYKPNKYLGETYNPDFAPYEQISKFSEMLNLLNTDNQLKTAKDLFDSYIDLFNVLDDRDRVTIADFHNIVDLCWLIKQDIPKPLTRGILLTLILNIMALCVNRHFSLKLNTVPLLRSSQEKIREVNTLIYILKVFKDTVKPFRSDMLIDDAYKFIERGTVIVTNLLRFERFYNAVFELGDESDTDIARLRFNYIDLCGLDVSDLMEINYINPEDVDVLVRLIKDHLANDEIVDNVNKHVYMIASYLLEKNLWNDDIRTRLADGVTTIANKISAFTKIITRSDSIDTDRWDATISLLLQSRRLVNLLEDVKVVFPFYDSSFYSHMLENQNFIKSYQKRVLTTIVTIIDNEVKTKPESRGFKMFNVNLKVNRVEVNYPEKLLAQYKEYLRIKELLDEDLDFRSIKLNADTDKYISEKKRFWHFAIRLKNIAEFYNNMERDVKPQYLRLLASDIIELEEHFKTTQNDEYKEFIDKSENMIGKMREKLEKAINVEKRVLNVFKQKLNTMDANFEYLDTINDIMTSFTTTKESKFERSFAIYIKQQAMLMYFTQVKYLIQQKELLLFKNTIKRIQLRYDNDDNQCELYPTLQGIRKDLYESANTIITPFFHFFDEFDNSYLKIKLSGAIGKDLEELYRWIEQTLNGLKVRIQELLTFAMVTQKSDTANEESTLKSIEALSIRIKDLDLVDDYTIFKKYIVIDLTQLKINYAEVLKNERVNLVQTFKPMLKQLMNSCESLKGSTSVEYQEDSSDNIKAVHEAYTILREQKASKQRELNLINAAYNVIREIKDEKMLAGHINDFLARCGTYEKKIKDAQVNIKKREGEFKIILQDRKAQLKADILEISSRNSVMLDYRVKLDDGLRDYDETLGIIKGLTAEVEIWNTIEKKIKNLKDDCEFFNVQFDENELKSSFNTSSVLCEADMNAVRLINELYINLETHKNAKLSDFLYSQADQIAQRIINIQEELKNERNFDKILLQPLLLKDIEEWRCFFDVITMIKGAGYTTEDWPKVTSILALHSSDPDLIQLKDLLNKKATISVKAIEIKKFNVQLVEQSNLRNLLKDINDWWEIVEFSIMHYENGAKTILSIIGGWEDLLTQLEDYKSQLAIIKDSAFISLYGDKVDVLESNFKFCEKVLYSIKQCQKRFIYLDPIMSKNQIDSTTGQTFDAGEVILLGIFSYIEKNRKLRLLKEYKDVIHQVELCVSSFEIVQKRLHEYLEEKRQSYPRLYFIGDEDLLELLGNYQIPVVLNSHLSKIFDKVNDVRLGVSLEIEGISSEDVYGYKETLKLPEPVSLSKSPIEVWLGQLETQIVKSLTSELASYIFLSLDDLKLFDNLLENWNNKPGQIIQLAQELIFTNSIAKYTSDSAINLLKSKYTSFLQSLAAYTPENPLKSLQLKSIKLSTITKIHILEKLSSADKSWETFKTLKFMQSAPGTIKGDICGVAMPYLWEYKGNTLLLVHTHITDKCFISISQAVRNKAGCNLTGPAGTGKTETIKSLGSLLARKVLVFNCDESLDYFSTIKIFKGIMGVGAWGCLDEFNRLNENQLSTASQLIQDLQTALKANKTTIQVDKYTFTLKDAAGVYITMNPKSKEYGARSTLPQNLKSLFRIVNVARPANTYIAEVILSTEGFINARSLANKLIDVIDKLKENVSKQRFYDWSLRKVKAVLLSAGDALKNDSSESPPDMKEMKAVVRSLDISVGSILTPNDFIIYRRILNEIFTHQSKHYNENITDDKDSDIDPIGDKLVQLAEQLKRRTGVIIFGHSNSQKTRLWRLYEERNKDNVEVHKLNPKASFKHEFIGSLDANTGIFKDGALTIISRYAAKNTNNKHQMILIDSEVDPGWIEALNSVLDDNKLLTLPSGERIQFDNRVNFVFECRDIEFASPATVSRMGLINMNGMPCKRIDNFDLIAPDSNLYNWSSIVDRNIEALNKSRLTTDSEVSSLSVLLLNLSTDRNTRNRLMMNISENISNDIDNSPMEFATALLSSVIKTNTNIFVATKREDDAILALQLSFDSLNQDVKLRVLSVSCTNNIDVDYMRQLLISNCSQREKGSSIVLEPQDYTRLVIVFHDIESVARDEYSHSAFYELLHYISAYGRFFDGTKFVEFESFITFVFVLRNLMHICNDKTYSKLTSNALCVDIDGLITTEGFEAYRNSSVSITNEDLVPNIENFDEITDDINNGPYGRVLKLYMRYFDVRKLVKMCENQVQLKKEMFKHLLYSEILLKAKSKEEQAKIFELLSDKYGIDLSPNDTYISLIESNGRESGNRAYASYKNLILKLKQRFERENYSFDLTLTTSHIQLFNAIEINLYIKDVKSHMIIGKPGFGRLSTINILSTAFDAKVVNFNSADNNTVKDLDKFIAKCLNDIFINNSKIFAIVESHQIKEKNGYDMLIRFIQEKDLNSLKKEDKEALVNQDKHYNGKGYTEYFKNKIQNYFTLFILYNDEVIDSSDMISDFPMMLKSFNIIQMEPLVNSSVVDELIDNCLETQTPNLRPHFSSIKGVIGQQMQADSISLIRAFTKTIETVKSVKSSVINNTLERLQNGLDSIHRAEAEITALHQEEEERRAQLMVKEEESSKYLAQIEIIYNHTSVNRDTMRITEKQIQEESKEASKRRRQVEIELETILPLVEKAKNDVKNINKKQLDEIRLLKSPPDTIIVVFGALLKMLGSDKVDWNEMKRFMGEKGAVDDILDFDPKSLTPSRTKALDEYISANSMIFDGKSAYRAFQAAGSLADYIVAMVKLSHTYAKIEPLETQLNKCEQRVTDLEKEINKQQQAISNVDDKIKGLKTELAQKTGEAEFCRKELIEIQKKSERAKILLEGFVNEKKRWHDQLDTSKIDHRLIEHKSLLTAYRIIFNGAKYTNGYDELRNMLDLESFDFTNFIAEPATLLEFKQNGLPELRNLIFNVLRANYSYSVPYIVDPSSVLLNFYIRLYGQNHVIVDLLEANHQLKLESCIKFGKTAIVINITEKIPTYLYSLIRKELRTQSNGTNQIEFLNKNINVSEKFKILLLNRFNSIPKIQEFSKYLNIIDNTFNDETVKFSVLQKIMQKKKSEVLESCARMMVSEVVNSRKVLELEEKILDLLNNRETSLLEDEKLQKALTEIKTQTSVVRQHMTEFLQSKLAMEKEEQKFVKIVQNFSSIFIEIDKLKNLSSFYSLTLDSFMSIIDMSLDEADSLGQIPTESILLSIFIKNLLNTLGMMFSNKDKPIFILAALKAAGVLEVTKDDWSAINSKRGEPLRSLPIKSINLKYTDSICFDYIKHNYKELYSNLVDKPESYIRWMSTLDIDQAKTLNLSIKQALLIVKALQTHSVSTLIEKIAVKQTGVRYIDLMPSTSKLVKLLNSPLTQNLMVLYKSGCDPAHDLESAAKQLSKKLVSISCGQLTAEQATNFIQNSTADICIVKNLHFSPWIFSHILSQDSASKKLMIFLTEDIKGLPRDLIMQCERVYYEKAEGVKRIIQQTILAISYNTLNDISIQANKYLFCLAYLFAIISEREKYAPLGWQKAYEFDINDFSAAVEFLYAVQNNQQLDLGKILREVLKYAFYGSKVDFEEDESQLRTLIEKTIDIDNGKLKLPLRNDMGAHLECIKNMPEIGLKELDLAHIDLDELQLQEAIDLFERTDYIFKGITIIN